jgi:hypothetical protein
MRIENEIYGIIGKCYGGKFIVRGFFEHGWEDVKEWHRGSCVIRLVLLVVYFIYLKKLGQIK